MRERDIYNQSLIRMGLIYLINNEQYTCNYNIQMLDNITDTIIRKISIYTYFLKRFT